jgi:hypothetical protein
MITLYASCAIRCAQHKLYLNVKDAYCLVERAAGDLPYRAALGHHLKTRYAFLVSLEGLRAL